MEAHQSQFCLLLLVGHYKGHSKEQKEQRDTKTSVLWRPFTGGSRPPPPMPVSSLEASQLEEGELLTAEDSMCFPGTREDSMCFLGTRESSHRGQSAPGWLQGTVSTGGSSHCCVVLRPEDTGLCQRKGFGQLKPHRAWALCACLSAFPLWREQFSGHIGSQCRNSSNMQPQPSVPSVVGLEPGPCAVGSEQLHRIWSCCPCLLGTCCLTWRRNP